MYNVIKVKEVIDMKDDLICAIRMYLRNQGHSFAVADLVANKIADSVPANQLKEQRDYWIEQLKGVR